MKRLCLAYQPTRTDYLFVLLLMCFSGNQAFITGPRQEPLLALMVLVAVLRMIKLRRGVETQTFLLVTFSYLAILLIQMISSSHVSLVTQLGFLSKLVVGAGVVSTVRFFRLAFLRVMVWLAVLSLVFHIPNVLAALVGVQVYKFLGPIADLVGADPTGVNLRVNVLLHNFMGGEGVFRNAGMFWEPGAFSGYLLLALVFLATIQSELPPLILKRWRAVLVVAELSTLSTTGYLFLPFALFTFRLVALEERRDVVNRLLWVLLFLLLLVPASTFLWQLDFVGPKIETLFARAVNQDAGWQVSRFGAVIFDWTHIQERPLFGWGQSNTALYSLFPSLEGYATGNGLTGYVRQMGAAGLLLFLVFFWTGLGRIGVTKWTRTMVFSIVVFQLNGEQFLTYPLYLGLHFIRLERNPKSAHRPVRRLKDVTSRSRAPRRNSCSDHLQGT